jgi:hypothetical protein
MKFLDLLDDAPGTNCEDRLEALTRSACQPKPVKRTELATRATTAPAPKKTFFTSRPSLRELMREYNRPITSRPPIRAEKDRATVEQEFNFERIDRILLPSIPAKILRPARRC